MIRCLPRRSIPAFVLTLSLAATGCAGLGQQVVAPEVTLEAVRLLEAGLGHQRFRLDFQAVNPNGFPIPVRAVEYSVRLAGHPFASGATPESFTLPAGGDGRFSIDVDTDLLRSASMLSTLVFREGRREIGYELGGTLRVNIPFTKAVEFRETGKVLLNTP